MDLYNLSEKIHNRILSKASHPYLVRFLDHPAINETKLQLLILLLNTIEIPDEEKERYIMAAMLLQTALDIHDAVSETKAGEDNDRLRNRQLTVLSGDYYSGLYYHILAELGQIELIKSLAEGIKIINEEKIIVGQFKLTDEFSILESFKRIESSLITKIGQCLHAADYTRLFEEILLVERLLKEKDQYDERRYSLLYESFSWLLHRKSVTNLDMGERVFLEGTVLSVIVAAFQNCEEKFRSIKPLYPELTAYIAGKLDKYETSFNSFVEEG